MGTGEANGDLLKLVWRQYWKNGKMGGMDSKPYIQRREGGCGEEDWMTYLRR